MAEENQLKNNLKNKQENPIPTTLMLMKNILKCRRDGAFGDPWASAATTLMRSEQELPQSLIFYTLLLPDHNTDHLAQWSSPLKRS